MKRAIQTHLPATDAPLEWAVEAGGVLYTAHVPLDGAGRIESGDIAAQTELTLRNLTATIEAAGGTMADVVQVQIFLTRAEDFAVMNEVYARFFTPPYPNRATMVVAGLILPGTRIEITACAHLGAANPWKQDDPRGTQCRTSHNDASARHQREHPYVVPCRQ